MNTNIKNIKKLIINQSLKLDCGKIIKDFPIAYETYGTLNKNKDNAILVFHALSGDQFATNINPIGDFISFIVMSIVFIVVLGLFYRWDFKILSSKIQKPLIINSN